MGSSQSAEGQLLPDEKPDTVYFFHFGRWGHGPSNSMFCLKLETFLRLAKVPYEAVVTRKMGKKNGKLPYLRYNGVEIDDSALCVKFVRDVMKIDLDGELSAEQRGIGVAVQRMVENATYCWLIHSQWLDHSQEHFEHFANGGEEADRPPRFIAGLVHRHIRGTMNKALFYTGHGRHGQEDRHAFFEEEVASLAGILGDKPFICGPAPTSFDCATFATLALGFFTPFQHEKDVVSKFPNLVAYCERIRDLAWPDWDEIKSKAPHQPAGDAAAAAAKGTSEEREESAPSESG